MQKLGNLLFPRPIRNIHGADRQKLLLGFNEAYECIVSLICAISDGNPVTMPNATLYTTDADMTQVFLNGLVDSHLDINVIYIDLHSINRDPENIKVVSD